MSGFGPGRTLGLNSGLECRKVLPVARSSTAQAGSIWCSATSRKLRCALTWATTASRWAKKAPSRPGRNATLNTTCPWGRMSTESGNTCNRGP